MKWEKLISYEKPYLSRGNLLKFKTNYPFEEQVIMMICEDFGNPFLLGLITITGYKSGINMFVLFPKEAICEYGLSKKWLESNWIKWVYPDTRIDDVYIRDTLNFNEL